ncbi:RICIN domain-containing protein [Gordonibacter massiliensis (ex Traore et al. 2017)]|uniref:RICIN domain-containing protein n=1 Tax=Gordonibacter massiliensis (ex Traore et al. 2017) TaxID=1841863 RepID=A0A842JM17_9ACTN|nr:RICIN domain-containing protein [Gordonibacter massiliensis (ex Traore et al. 2017)]
MGSKLLKILVAIMLSGVVSTQAHAAEIDLGLSADVESSIADNLDKHNERGSSDEEILSAGSEIGDKDILDASSGMEVEEVLEEPGKVERSTEDELADNRPEKVIPVDFYALQSWMNTDYVVDTAFASEENGAEILLWKNENNPWQRFEIQYDNEGYFILQNCETGGVLDIEGASDAPGTRIVQWERNGGKNQKWRAVNNSDGSISVLSAYDGLALSVEGDKAENGSPLVICEVDANSKAQRFRFEAFSVPASERIVADGVYTVSSRAARNIVLDVAGDHLSNGANVLVRENAGQPSQRFYFKWVDGYYEIACLASGKVLDIEASSRKRGANVDQWERNGGMNQRWVLVRVEDDAFALISPMNGYCLDLAGGQVLDGINAQMWPVNRGDNQAFAFEVAASIDSGVYSIASSLDRSKVLDIAWGLTDDGAQVDLWDNNCNPWQKFLVEYCNDGTYLIKSVNSAKPIGVKKMEGVGDPVTLLSGNANECHWVFVPSDNGEWNIVSAETGLLLDVSWGSAVNGQDICVWSNNGGPNQRFLIESANTIEDGYYTISSSLNPTFALDVEAASKLSGANLGLWGLNGVDWQKFRITNKGNGYVSLTSFESGKVLDVEGASTLPESNVLQWDFTGADNQLWIIEPLGENSYAFASKQTGMRMEVQEGAAFNGANICVNTARGSSAQGFSINRINAFKVYLDAGHGPDGDGRGSFDSGALGNGYSEYYLTVELVNMIDSILKTKYGLKTFKNIDGGWYVYRHGEAVAEGCTTLVSIHFNSSNSVFATGTESYIHNYNASPGSSALQGIVHQYLVKGTGLFDRGKKKAELAVCGGRLPAVLCEIAFISNYSDILNYQNRKWLIAESIAEGIAEASTNTACAY